MGDEVLGGNYEAIVASAIKGDERAFGRLVERHRREIHVHCYRMLGSFDDAEDRVQEVFLRAWSKRETFEGRSSYRAWLYRIATNACIELLRRQPKNMPRLSDSTDRLPSFSAFPSLQPYPDVLLDEVENLDDGPEVVAVTKSTIELAFLAAIQLLPPVQRAVLLLREVLEFSAAETASFLDMTTVSVNSSLQRARATMQKHQRPAAENTAMANASSRERLLVQRYIDAHQALDPEPIINMLREDARLTILPIGMVWEGKESIVPDYRKNMGGLGHFRSVATFANRQPAVAHYLRKWDDTEFRAFTLVVLSFEDEELVDFTTFMAPQMFANFGLDLVLAPS